MRFMRWGPREWAAAPQRWNAVIADMMHDHAQLHDL